MFYIQECRDIIVSLNTEILEKTWKSIKVTPFHGIETIQNNSVDFQICKEFKKQSRKQQFLLEPFITSAELRASQIIWLKENKKKFDEKRLRILTMKFNLIYDDDNLIRCEGRLKKRPTAL